ncbi:ABC transporter ATP-binding protein [Dermabacteraceae bacterium P13128]
MAGQETRAATPAVCVSGVSKRFRDGDTHIEALKPTSFTLQRGEFVAVIGPSGSGKSTLLTLLGGLQTPSAGSVEIAGVDTSALSGRELVRLRREKIGFVLQAANLVPYLRVREQLELADRVCGRGFDRQRAEALADELNMREKMSAFPGDLSGGERQRAAIMRALYPRPALLLADEPTASLDSARAFSVVEILAQEAHRENVTVVMVTHDERMLPYCDRVLRIEDGVLSE